MKHANILVRFSPFVAVLLVALVVSIIPQPTFAEELSLGTFSRIPGGLTSNELGASIASAGDVNGDGYDDILVGDTFDSENGTQAGAAYLFYGQSTQFASLDDIDFTNAVKFTGETAGDQAGFSVSGGDVNGDGYADILIGAPANNNSTGAVYLIYGRAQALTSMNLSSAIAFTGMAENDRFGRSVAVVGDTNGDTFADYIIGAPYHDNDSTGEVDAGAVYVVLGSPTAFISGSIFGVGDKIMSEQISAYAGFSVAGAGDVNSDGFNDMLVGAPGDASGDGVAYLIFGQSISYQQTFFSLLGLGDAIQFSGNLSEYAGFSVAGAGDVNNDGFDDMLVGAELNSDVADNAGAAYLVYGASSYLSSSVAIADLSVQYTGVAEDDAAGSALAGVGDINNDGYTDFLISSPAYDVSEEMQDAGAVYAIIGSSNLPAAGTSVSLADAAMYTILGEQVGQSAGESVSSAGDMDNDGFIDVLVGSTDYDSSGALYIGYIMNDTDADNDGVATEDDCDDTDATASTQTTYYADEDEDGLGDPTVSMVACDGALPEGYVINNDDTNDTISNAGIEISNDEVDNDGDGDVDEVNTVSENGYHPAYGYNDPADVNAYDEAITSFVGGKNGNIKVTFADNSVYQYNIFDITTDKKTIVKHYKNSGFLIALQPSGKKMSLVSPFSGIIASTITLSKNTKYGKNVIQQYNLRKDKDDAIEIIVTSTNNTEARLSIVKVDLSSHELNKKDSVTLSSNAVDATNTEVKSKQITLENSSAAAIQVYAVSKKYELTAQ
ncbi:MAG: FG-GAP repeat protein [Candidatus Kerfeldbacteria bacterium]|nr:FG-GAP repeat protein [Candidatus Kerfeldbacteria bacterium]